ncbi:MAG: DUF1353 domain-containing protein [Pyrinomonadaceae bacterium]
MNIKELQKRVLQINQKVSAGKTVRVDLLIDKKDLPADKNKLVYNASLSANMEAEKIRTAATIEVSASGAKTIALRHFSPHSATTSLALAQASGSSETIDLNAVKLTTSDTNEKNALITKTRHLSREIDGVPEVKLTQKEVGKWWVVVEDCSYQTNGLTLTAPKDFQTDLASIPRFFWNIVAPFELSLPAPLFHDLIYRCEGKMVKPKIDQPHKFLRKDADDIFLELMVKKKVPIWKRTLAYWAVRGFAEFAWKNRP